MKRNGIISALLACALVSFFSFTPLAAQRETSPAWWGYYTPDMSVNAVGTGWSVTYDVCAFVPGGEYFAKGATLSGVRFQLPATSNLKNVRVWLSTSLPQNVTSADVAVKNVANAKLNRGGSNEVMFDTPYEITEKGVYVGYSLTISTVSTDEDLRPIAYTADVHAPRSLYLRTSDGYTEWADYSADFGALALEMLFEGGLGESAVGVESAQTVSAAAGTTTAVPVTLCNYSPEGVGSIDYVVSTDGEESAPQHYALPSPFMAYGPFVAKLPVSAGDAAGEVSKMLRITHVNGHENRVAAADATAALRLNVLGEVLPKKVVIEEFSGTWCAWCPLGARGVELSREKFGDKVISIEVHDQDVMWDSSLGYDPLIATLVGIPLCFINRSEAIDPYYGTAGGDVYGLDADIEEELSRTAEASIALEAQWNDRQTAVEARSTVTFQRDYDSADYALGYVVTAGELTGEGKEWAQTNGLSGDASLAKDENLSDLVAAAKLIPNYTYHNVAIAAAGVETGVKGSLPASITAGKPLAHTQTFDLTDCKLLQDKTDLSVVCFLFNRQTGRIVNAERASVATADAIGILRPSQTLAGEKIYNLQGQEMPKLKRGVNLLRRSDGGVEKIICR